MRYSDEIKEAAKQLYLQRFTIKEISKRLNINSSRVVYYWAERNNWDDQVQHESVESAISRRLVLLTERENKTKVELSEIDRLIDNLVKINKIKKTGDTTSDKKTTKKKSSKIKNDISDIKQEDFNKHFVSHLFDYQSHLRDIKNSPDLCRNRNILKARQIGLTYYFAGEAFEDAVLNGDNQIFLSASKAQAEIFRAYIIAFAKDWFDIELKGNPIVLSNGAELRFVSTNAKTAQGYHGHVYFDEYFWTLDWDKLQTVASGMAMHKKWRKTYFSTPSTINHPAYKMWTGDKFNHGRKKKIEFDVSHKTLKEGALCADGVYRQIITIQDAIAAGCGLFDLAQLKLEYTADEFSNLLMCHFIDDTHGVFALTDLQKCYTDKTLWTDYQPDTTHPFSNLPVWLGFDPSRTLDNSTLTIIAPPIKPGGLFRVLEKHHYQGQSFTYQANRIKDLCDKFNVQYIGIDTTGIGYGVYDLVKAFFPRTTPINYNIESKTNLVLKALDVVQNKRIQWDAGQTEIAHAFLTIKKTVTQGGQITYSANRTDATGHADVAWSIMHALANEPLNITHNRRTKVAFSQ